MTKKILFISNGKGEDSIAVTIINKLNLVATEEKQPITIKALPLIGNGTAYNSIKIQVLNSWKPFNNGGFFNIFSILKGIFFGDLLTRFLSQKKFINNISKEYDLIVCIGDIIPVFLAILTRHKKIIHIATAMTNYIRNYNVIEKWLFRNKLELVINRDENTAQNLIKAGVKATFYGNPMLDDSNLELRKELTINLPFKKRNIILIPSSRDDAYSNLGQMAKHIVKFGPQNNMLFYFSLHPVLQLNKFVQILKKDHWEYIKTNDSIVIGYFTRENANKIYVINEYFREILEKTNVAIGMTGTGNEQVVGMGIPLILLRGKHKSSSWERLYHYKKLLGDAIFIPPLFNSDKHILEVLISQSKLIVMQKEGIKRMGTSGGSNQIAKKMFEVLMK